MPFHGKLSGPFKPPEEPTERQRKRHLNDSVAQGMTRFIIVTRDREIEGGTGGSAWTAIIVIYGNMFITLFSFSCSPRDLLATPAGSTRRSRVIYKERGWLANPLLLLEKVFNSPGLCGMCVGRVVTQGENGFPGCLLSTSLFCPPLMQILCGPC